MIVYEKQNGWKPTGDELPTETLMQILVDAAKEPLAGVYTYAEARKAVEASIAKNPDAHYRFDIVAASAKALRRAGAKAQPAAQPKAAPKRSPSNAASGAPPAHRQAKAARKPKGKAESGKQRHARLKAEGICTACGKHKAAPKPKAAGGGHYTECADCRAYFTQWAKDHAKKAGK